MTDNLDCHLDWGRDAREIIKMHFSVCLLGCLQRQLACGTDKKRSILNTGGAIHFSALSGTKAGEREEAH